MHKPKSFQKLHLYDTSAQLSKITKHWRFFFSLCLCCSAMAEIQELALARQVLNYKFSPLFSEYKDNLQFESERKIIINHGFFSF